MAQLLGYGSNITGTTGATNVLEPKSSYRVYVLPQGAHASASSTGTIITLGSTQAAARLTNGHYVQVGTDPANVRRVSAVIPDIQGNTVTVTAAVTVAAGDRVYLIGVTQPTVSGSSVTYQPNTTIYTVDESENATPTANSLVTTDSNGAFQFWPSTSGFYDALIQDSRVTNVGSLVDIEIGVVGTPLLPIQGRTDDIGSAALPWDDFTYSGKLISAVTSGSGVTYHRFDTTGGITGGALFHFANNGTVRLYGDSWGGVHQAWNLPAGVFNVKSARYGALGDNSTDDTEAFKNAIIGASTTANGANGGVVYVPRGTYIVNEMLSIGTKVKIVGDGRGTKIKAGGSHAGPYMVQMGYVGVNAHGARLENLLLDCDSIAGLGGVTFCRINEPSGLDKVVINNYMTVGIGAAGTGGREVQNFVIENCELFAAATATGSTGIQVVATGNQNTIRNTTITNINGSGASSTNSCISVNSAYLTIQDCHFESHKNGVFLTGVSNSVVSIHNSGDPVLDNLHFLGAAGGLNIYGGVTGGCVNWVSDGTGAGLGISSANWRHGDIYLLPADATDKFYLGSAKQSVIGSPMTFGTTLTVGGQFGVTGNATFSGTTTTVGGTLSVTGNIILPGGGTVLTQVGGVLTIPNGSWFGISGTGTAITSIAPVTSGRLIFLMASAGSQAFNETAGLHVATSPMTMNASGNPDFTAFFCAGATWQQVALPAL